MMYYNENTFMYLNGQVVKASDAKIDLYSQTLHYGYGVFEGIRSYRTVTGATKIFKEQEHFERLQHSAQAMNMPYPWDSNELIRAAYEVLARNQLADAYIRPLVYAPANMSFSPNSESFIAIEAWEMKPFLGERLLRVMTSSFERPNPRGCRIEAKATGHYVNSILASQEAKANGFDEALLCDMDGFVAEAPGANIFLEREGKLLTPARGNILPGITRATVFDICASLHVEVVEKQITPGELARAESAFFCGTAAEIIGIASIDGNAFPRAWPGTLGATIEKTYQDLVREKITLEVFV